MRDDVLFFIANDVTDENILAVLSALQGYELAAITKNNSWNSVHKDDRKLDLHIHIVCDLAFETILSKCLTCVEGIHPYDNCPNGDWTYVARLSIAEATAIAKSTDKPLANALGIIIGSEAGSMPDVSNLCSEFDSSDLILFPQYTLFEDIRSLGVITPGMRFSTQGMDLDAKSKTVFQSKAVIGHSCFETYLACCLKKPVLEIQTSKQLFKWSNPNYICITEVSDDVLIKGVKLCLSAIEELTPMALAMSTVQDVQNSSVRPPL